MGTNFFFAWFSSKLIMPSLGYSPCDDTAHGKDTHLGRYSFQWGFSSHWRIQLTLRIRFTLEDTAHIDTAHIEDTAQSLERRIFGVWIFLVYFLESFSFIWSYCRLYYNMIIMLEWGSFGMVHVLVMKFLFSFFSFYFF